MNTLTLLTIGGGNTAAGYASLHANDAGCCNVADGAFTLNHNTGSYNTAVGSQAMQSNVGSAENVAIGDSALFTDTAGGNNTAVGAFALYNATGFSNTALGYLAGNNIMTGSDNIDIGNEGATADAATIRIGTAGQHTSTFIAGIVGTTMGASHRHLQDLAASSF